MLDWRVVQQWLKDHGYYPADFVVDGLPAFGTRVAMIKARRAHNMGIGDSLVMDRPMLQVMGLPLDTVLPPPWMPALEARRAMLGDAGSSPAWDSVWAGALADALIVNAGYGPVPSNPYLPASWASYGKEEDPKAIFYGCLLVFESMVGFAKGISADGAAYLVATGASGLKIADRWMPADLLLHARMPLKYDDALQPPLPILIEGNGVRTVPALPAS